MFWKTIKKNNISTWDLLTVETKKTPKDARPESRKIRNESVVNTGCAIKDREKRRSFLSELTDNQLPNAAEERKTLSLIRPTLFSFSVEKREETIDQATLYSGVFKRRPYQEIGLFYEFKCGEKGCSMCSQVGKLHRMECFDFGANHLYRKYDDEIEAREKVRDMCFKRMKFDFNCWFAMGTHSAYPFLRWMIVGLLWMKKKVV